jgi:hypothetical protein
MSTLDERREALKQRGKLPEPVRRKEATQATLDKFKGQPFDWGEGRHCVRLAHFHLRQMGQKPPTLPRIRSALAAKKALRERGWASVSDMLDSILVRIPPAMMQLGDVATVEGDQGLDALFVCAGPNRLFGWREDEAGAVVLEVTFDQVKGSWRV